jgi:hypothetical protein
MYDLKEIRERVSLVALAESAGAKFENPHRLVSHCPLPRHAGDRSSRAFSIYDNGRKWKCHSSCPSNANSGDVIDFYRHWKGVDFKTAVEDLAHFCNVKVNSENVMASTSVIPPAPAEPSQTWHNRAEQFVRWAESNLAGEVGAGARAYVENERGLSPATWRAFRLGYNPKTLYDDPARWGLNGKKIWLPRGIVIPGFWHGEPWYIKVRRPMPTDVLGQYIGAWKEQDGLADVKFGGPRGGRSVLFHLELSGHKPILFLTEGEWDAMLLWEYCPYLCDAGTIGGAGAKFDTLDLALLTRYLAVLVVHDDDKAGQEGREYIAKLHAMSSRIISITPPAHDLTDFWRSGGNIRGWTAGHVARTFANVFIELGIVDGSWKRIAEIAESESDTA